jgi:hypothetical protein
MILRYNIQFLNPIIISEEITIILEEIITFNRNHNTKNHNNNPIISEETITIIISVEITTILEEITTSNHNHQDNHQIISEDKTTIILAETTTFNLNHNNQATIISIKVIRYLNLAQDM